MAVDLVDTVIAAHDAEARRDLLVPDPGPWWELEGARLPADGIPSPEDTARLRSALRAVIEARIESTEPAPSAVADLNRFARRATSSPQLVAGQGLGELEVAWTARRPGDIRLAAVARDGIQLVTDPVVGGQLRACANPACSMVFLAENPRRIWCAANVCGNRARVARFQRRHRDERRAES